MRTPTNFVVGLLSCAIIVHCAQNGDNDSDGIHELEPQPDEEGYFYSRDILRLDAKPSYVEEEDGKFLRKLYNIMATRDMEQFIEACEKSRYSKHVLAEILSKRFALDSEDDAEWQTSTLLFEAIDLDHLEFVDHLKSIGVDPNVKNHAGGTVLFKSVAFHDDESLDQILTSDLKHHNRLDLVSNIYGSNAIHRWITKWNLKCGKLLVSWFENVSHERRKKWFEQKDKDGYTALHLAIKLYNGEDSDPNKYKSLHFIELLKKWGADGNTTIQKGNAKHSIFHTAHEYHPGNHDLLGHLSRLFPDALVRDWFYLRSQIESKEKENQCVICMSNERTHAFDGCYHRIACGACAPQVLGNRCPKCRQNFTRIQRVYD